MSSSQDPPGELVFVYGTMRKGATNYPRMKGALRISPGVVRGRLVKIGWFPALVLDPKADSWVWGDVFRVDGVSLQAFLEYEGLAAEAKEDQDCRLGMTKVYSYAGSGWNWNVRLWEWIGPLDQAVPIASGDWLDVECPKSAPLYTWVAGACALAMPALVISSLSLRRSVGDLLEMLLLFGGLLSPVAGWVAVHWAFRRRESWEPLRAFVIFGLLIASIPCVIGLVALLGVAIKGIF